MTMWLMAVELIILDASREQEFNDWSNNIHLPDVLETPGFTTATRYVIKEFRDARGKYCNLYEIETDDIDKTMEIRREKREQEKKRGRYGNILDGVNIIWQDVLWRQIVKVVADKEHDPDMEKWINLVETHCTDASREKEYNDWYTNVHVPDVLKTPGFMAATRYEAKEFRNGRGKYSAIYEIETNDIDKTMEIRRETRKSKWEQGRQNDLWVSVWRDVLWKRLIRRTADEL